MDVAGFGPVEIREERVDHDIAHQVNLVLAVALVAQVVDGVR